MSELVTVKLDDGREISGRWATLDEWLLPLPKDHPARRELHSLRSKLGAALAAIDKLERDNASLHQQFRELASEQQQPVKENEPIVRTDAVAARLPKVVRAADERARKLAIQEKYPEDPGQ